MFFSILRSLRIQMNLMKPKKVYHSRDNDYLSLVAIFRLDIPLDTMSIFDNAMENVAITV